MDIITLVITVWLVALVAGIILGHALAGRAAPRPPAPPGSRRPARLPWRRAS